MALVGALGGDAFGRQLREGLRRRRYRARPRWPLLDDEGSGTASITVAEGDNQIVIVPAANARVTPAQVERAQALIAHADAVLVQMEIPLETVEATVRLGHRLGVPVILNPAPAQPCRPNGWRWPAMSRPTSTNWPRLLGAADGADFRTLMERAPCPVVLTRGSEGAWYREREGAPMHQPGFAVDVVDTTGAGDTFNGALAVFLHEGLATAVRKACAAAALSVGKLGAQGGMPRRDALDAFLASRAT